MERRRRGGASASNEETTHLLWEETSKSLIWRLGMCGKHWEPKPKKKMKKSFLWLGIRLEPKQTEPKRSFFGFTFS